MRINDDLTIPIPDGFSLSESRAFLTGFSPVANSGDNVAIDLAFALDGDWEPVGVRVTEAGNAIAIEVIANPEGAANADIRANVERILSLNHDGSAYAAIGERDPVVGRLQRARPGLRPPLFPSGWEAGVWAILSQRTRRALALSIKHGLAKAHGTPVTFPNGAVVHSFPGPAIVRQVNEIPSLPLQKLGWIHSLAEGALRGQLDCEHLANVTREQGMDELRVLPGIGPFSAELILARGAGNPDIFPMHEPRVHDAMTMLYGDSSLEKHAEIAAHWIPYRGWVSLLLRVWYDGQRNSAGMAGYIGKETEESGRSG